MQAKGNTRHRSRHCRCLLPRSRPPPLTLPPTRHEALDSANDGFRRGSKTAVSSLHSRTPACRPGPSLDYEPPYISLFSIRFSALDRSTCLSNEAVSRVLSCRPFRHLPGSLTSSIPTIYAESGRSLCLWCVGMHASCAGCGFDSRCRCMRSQRGSSARMSPRVCAVCCVLRARRSLVASCLPRRPLWRCMRACVLHSPPLSFLFVQRPRPSAPHAPTPDPARCHSRQLSSERRDRHSTEEGEEGRSHTIDPSPQQTERQHNSSSSSRHSSFKAEFSGMVEVAAKGTHRRPDRRSLPASASRCRARSHCRSSTCEGARQGSVRRGGQTSVRA